jgi:uncharacterized RDD family membrane protein YckC
VSDDEHGTESPAVLRAVPREAREFQGQHAGIVTRSMAGVVDGLTIVAIVLAWWVGFGAVRFLAHPARFTIPNYPLLVDGVFWCIVAVVYFTVAWATSGRTVGAQLLGLRVVNRHRKPVRWGVSALRAALCVIFPVGMLWTMVSRQNLSAQDILLGTLVIYDWRTHATRDKHDPPQTEASPRE